MARNEEKQYSKLNRMILQRDKEGYEKKFPKRPRLDHLHTVDEIKEWLPSITRDIDINLKQCQAPCYTDSKIGEYQQKVLRFEREFKAFVRKMHQLQPGMEETPWTDRPYQSKKQAESNIERNATVGIRPISTPLLDLLPPQEKEERPLFSNCNLSLMDQPLNFDYEDQPSAVGFPTTGLASGASFHKQNLGRVLLGLDYGSSSDSEGS